MRDFIWSYIEVNKAVTTVTVVTPVEVNVTREECGATELREQRKYLVIMHP